MISAARIKFIKALSQKKFRKEHGLFIAEGEKIVNELINNPAWEIRHIYGLETWKEKHTLKQGIDFSLVSEKELGRISTLSTPNKVLALVNTPQHRAENVYLEEKYTLMLDDIQDPGNMGTLLRTADWFGIENIICSENTVEAFNPKVIQASMGSFMRVKTHYTSLPEFLNKLPEGFPVMGALLEGENLHEYPLPAEGIIVTGNESKGISQALLKHINHKLHIPLYIHSSRTSYPESLNVAVAAGIILSHIRKKA